MKFATTAAAVLALAASLSQAAAPPAVLSVVSSPPQYVSGGNARIRIDAPAALHGTLELQLNGHRVEPPLAADGDRLEGVLEGLAEGTNRLELRQAGQDAPLATLELVNHPITGPMFSGPHQAPFVCLTSPLGRQPLVDSETPPGFAVRDERGRVIGYSRHCMIEPYVSYWYLGRKDRWQELPRGGARPRDMQQVTLPDGRQVDFIVRQERGTINRFIYSFAMLAPAPEERHWTAQAPDTRLWNGRLQYWFHGGVGVGHSQGRLHGGALNAEVLATGTAIAHSTGNRTSTHYNLPLASETAMMTKERFIERHGVPLYTYGLGGSGGAIQQFALAQSHPGVLDALLPQLSYPDMITQTIHALDCELLEHYMDVTDGLNPKWRRTRNRSLLVGMNARDGKPFEHVNDLMDPYKREYGVAGAPGSTECVRSWRGLTPLTLNPHYGRARGQEQYMPPSAIAAVRWTHWDDARNVYGVDEHGAARRTWDNVGVQYGLRSLRQGRITPAEFLDLNWRIGGWKPASEMVQEGFPYLGTPDHASFDPWSRRNMTLSPDRDTPAPRTHGDLQAMQAAYSAGMVFSGRLPVPTIDHRQYLERDLDMHNAHQSFALRQRVLREMGHSDHLVIWFTDTRPGKPRFSQTPEAIAVMDEWMANLRAHPEKGIAGNRPPRAVDSCFDVRGQLIYGGHDAWDGILDSRPPGPCTRAFPLYGTSRTVAGAPIEGSMFRCALKSVDQALADGTYAPWVPDAAAVARLRRIFPDGVCDYSQPDQASLPPDEPRQAGPRKAEPQG